MKEIVRYSTLLIVILVSVVIYYTLKKWKTVPKIESKKAEWYFKLMPVVLLAAGLYLILMPAQLSVLAMWKRICILAILWPVAYIDLKEHLIPNVYLILALVMRGIILIPELCISPMDAVAQFLSELIGCGILLAFCLLVRIVSRKGLGMGDVKLFSILPLFLGALGGMRAMMYSMVIIFVQACFCLITKRKGKKDVLPFAPSIAGGVWIIVILSGI